MPKRLVAHPEMSPGRVHSRNLVLVHTDGWQDVRDFLAIKAHVEALAPDIEVLIASNSIRSSVTRRRAARRPSLVFSPIRLVSFRPERGTIYQGRPMSKLKEMQTLADAGIPVPTFQEITPDTVLSLDRYGPLVIVKPSYELASWGAGIELMRTEEVRYRPPEAFAPDHFGRRGPMIAQKFVDCGYAMTCRVLTFFGVPIFAFLRRSTRPMTLARRASFEQADFMPTPPHRTASITNDPEMLAFAARAYKAMPDVALQACDILRDEDGALHLLEINPGGGTWMFSSRNAPNYRSGLGIEDLSAPFDAFRTCARILVEKTRTQAT